MSDMFQLLGSAGWKTNPLTLPRMKPSLYHDLHSQFIVPLNIQINIAEYEQEVLPFRSLFRRWGPAHHDLPRFGLPLVNLTGDLQDAVDPSCWPLDKWWKEHPGELYWDHDFNRCTEVMNLPSLQALDPIAPYMIRSCLLLWDKEGKFFPHVDSHIDLITHLHVWGTTKSPHEYELFVEGERVMSFEPGRLYLVDTTRTHSARALVDNAHTFFITVDLEATDTIKQLIVR